MRRTERLMLTLPTRDGARTFRRFWSCQGAMRAASGSAALWDRVRIVRLPDGAGFDWLHSHDALPRGGRVVAEWSGSEWT